MSQVTKRAFGAVVKKPAAEEAPDEDYNQRYRRGLRHQPHDFYYHFKDIYDLVEWACLEDARAALEEKKTYDTWQEGFLQIFEAVRENKPFIMNVYRCVHQEQVERYLKPLVDQLLLDVINEEAAGMTVRDEDKAFIARIYSYVFVGLMLDWIRDDMQQDPKSWSAVWRR